MSDIVVLGSINMDMVAHVKAVPQVGETVLGHRFDVIPGGKGANQAVAAARLGAATTMLGRVGDDQLGQDLLASLAGAGVKTTHVTVTPGTSSGVALISVSEVGDNAIVAVPGANGALTVDDVERAKPLIQAARIFMVQLEIPLETVARGLALAKAAGVTTLLDPAPAQPLASDVLALVDVIMPNELEATTLTGTAVDTLSGAETAAAALCQHAQAAIVKLGSRGVVVRVDGETTHIPAHQVDVVDTTAAGDAFAGGLATALLAGRDLVAAARFANAVAALSTTRSGAQPAMPTRAAVDQFIAQQRDA